MELVIKLILSLAFVDFLLTLFWIYRWQSSRHLKKFKKKLPIRIIEANPIINHTINYFGTYPGAVLGYAAVLVIQIALAGLHEIVAWIVCAVLVLVIRKHIRNNLTTTNKHIEKLTKEYNLTLKKINQKEVKNE